jgi:predicted nucleotidyltransferase component of viral defense system
VTDQGREPGGKPGGGRFTSGRRDRSKASNLRGLQHGDLTEVMERFGVSEAQVRRDHAISLILAALSTAHRDDVLFFGGTALNRTYLDDQRLSEDIDLIANDQRYEVAERLVRTIEGAVQRTHGRVSWEQGFSRNDDVEPAIALLSGGIAIKIQLLKAEGYEPWPTGINRIEQRYSDVGEATLRTPTLPAFAGWKTSAWVDRAAPRDLYDLWAMSRLGALDLEAAQMFAKHGPTSAPPKRWMFNRPPSEKDSQGKPAWR